MCKLNKRQKVKKREFFSSKFSFGPAEIQLFSPVKPILIHWLSNEPHGKSETLEVNIEDFRIVWDKIDSNVCYDTFN